MTVPIKGPSKSNTPWDDERTETAKRRWADGASCGAIADELGHGISRNAVIGKLHRLGLTKTDKPTRGPAKASAAGMSETPHKQKYRRRNLTREWSPSSGGTIEPEPVFQNTPADNVIPQDQRRTLLQLTEDTCRWPVGDPGTPDFFFCGAAPKAGRPYCAYHSRIAYQPLPARRPRPNPWW